MAERALETAIINSMQREEVYEVRPHHHAVALLVASFSVFLATGTIYYHFFRLGTAIDHNFLTDSIVRLHDFLGWPAILMFTALPFVWSMIFFFSEKIHGLGIKTLGWISSTGFLAVLLGCIDQGMLGGSFGVMMGQKLLSMLSSTIVYLLLTLSLFMALFLATERFFFLHKTNKASESSAANPLGGPSGVTTKEAAVLDEEITEEITLEEEPETQVQKQESAANEDVQVDRAMATQDPEQEEAFDLDVVLELEEAAVQDSLAGEQEEQEEIVEAEPLPIPPKTRDEKISEIAQAADRATKDYVLPAVQQATPEEAPAVNADPGEGALLDKAAKLVIEEGRASVSLLQRRLSIPFSRASLLLDILEREGLVSPYRGGPARDILMTLEDWEKKAAAKQEDSSSSLPQA